MEIQHRIVFSAPRDQDQGVRSLLDELDIPYEYSPAAGPLSGLVTLEISESDTRWPRVSALAQAMSALDRYDTVFTTDEILDAEWLRLIPAFQTEYPQPEKSWVTNPPNYEGGCSTCGVGYRQTAPFHLSKEPRMGRHELMCLYWTWTIFCTDRIAQALAASGCQGYDLWRPTVGRGRQASTVVAQLVPREITSPGLLDGDVETAACPTCGAVKHGWHQRGYMHFDRQALRTGTDFLYTHEWFGSGHAADREILITNGVARLLIDVGDRDIVLKPILVVDSLTSQ